MILISLSFLTFSLHRDWFSVVTLSLALLQCFGPFQYDLARMDPADPEQMGSLSLWSPSLPKEDMLAQLQNGINGIPIS